MIYLLKNVFKLYREGLHELISWIDTKKIPILVLSSGLGEAVVDTLEAANITSAQLKVSSKPQIDLRHICWCSCFAYSLRRTFVVICNTYLFWTWLDATGRLNYYKTASIKLFNNATTFNFLFQVVSNFLELDSEDIIIGMKGNPIHSLNKNEAGIKNTEYYDTIKGKKNVILMGDTIGDANMVDGFEDLETVIKIGYLGNQRKTLLSDYLKHFDIVLQNDQTMDVINDITKHF